MNPLQRALRRVDAVQRRSPALSFVYAVLKKYGDDTAGNLAALITYYGFLSLFPLLLVLVTVLGLVAGSNPSFAHGIEHSALSEFPVIGTHLKNNIQALKRDSALGLLFGIVALIWGAQGAVQTGQKAMADVWNVPTTDRPGFVPRVGRSFAMLGVLGVFLVLTTAAAGFASFTRGVPVIAQVGTEALSVVLNVALYVLAFWILTPKSVPRRHLLPGAVVGGVAWSVLQYAGTLLVNHELKGSDEVYGVFAIVLGLIAWIYFGARTTMYAAELNVVRARRLWPRSLVQPPLTPADEAVYTALSLQARHRPEQRVQVDFTSDVDSPRSGRSGARRDRDSPSQDPHAR